MKHLSKTFLKRVLEKGEIFKLLLDQKVTEAQGHLTEEERKTQDNRLECVHQRKPEPRTPLGRRLSKLLMENSL